MTTFTKEELIGLQALVLENRDSSELQDISKISYLESIYLNEKISTAIDAIDYKIYLFDRKNDYSIDRTADELIIKDIRNKQTYNIPDELILGEIISFDIINRESEIFDLERFISEANSESDKTLMREDLGDLNDSVDEYIFSYYGTNGYITKEKPELFAKTCEEIIKSYKNYLNNLKELAKES